MKKISELLRNDEFQVVGNTAKAGGAGPPVSLYALSEGLNKSELKSWAAEQRFEIFDTK